MLLLCLNLKLLCLNLELLLCLNLKMLLCLKLPAEGLRGPVHTAA
jgi:hypothetical protein